MREQRPNDHAPLYDLHAAPAAQDKHGDDAPAHDAQRLGVSGELGVEINTLRRNEYT